MSADAPTPSWASFLATRTARAYVEPYLASGGRIVSVFDPPS